MRSFDLSPLYKSAIGFDRFASLMDEALRQDTQPGYPPYNIELVKDDNYRISMAVAGFADSEIEIMSEGDTLVVTGKKDKTDEPKTWLHRGIAERNFERRFRLADHVKVTAARMENGLLHIELVREIPEALKPRKIAIESDNKSRLIEDKAA
ncbi:MAG TPA: Hsp20 family protein [Gammaproteobacteria bacterium]